MTLAFAQHSNDSHAWRSRQPAGSPAGPLERGTALPTATTPTLDVQAHQSGRNSSTRPRGSITTPLRAWGQRAAQNGAQNGSS